MTQAQDWFSKNMKRKSMSEDKSKSSLVSVSPASLRTNVSESSKQKQVNLEKSQECPTEKPSLVHDSNSICTEKLELALPGNYELSKTQSDITLTKPRNSLQEKDQMLTSPKQSEKSDSAKPSPATPGSLCQRAQESPDDQILMSSESTPTPPETGSPKLDQLLLDLEKMKLKFRPETLDPQLSELSDESPQADDIYEFEGLSPENIIPTDESHDLRVSMPTATQLGEDTNLKNVAITEPGHFQTPIQDEPEIISVTPHFTETSEETAPSSLGSRKDSPVSLTDSLSTPEYPNRGFDEMESLNLSIPVNKSHFNTYDENATETFSSVSFPKVAAKSTSEIPQDNVSEEDSTHILLQNREELESATSSKDSMGLTEEISTQSIQLPLLWEDTFLESIQTDDVSSQSVPDLTPETVTSTRHFCFEELMTPTSPGNLEKSSDEDRPNTSGRHSEESLTSVDSDLFVSQSTPVQSKAETTSLTSDEEYSLPTGYPEATIYIHMPPSYEDVVNSCADSPPLDYSDPEPYFDCNQAGSDFSETEPETSTSAKGDQPKDHYIHPRVLKKVNQRVLLSSGSEDFEDASLVHEPFFKVQEESEALLHYSEASDEEFTLCKTSQPPTVLKNGEYCDTDTSLTREINAELGLMSESSDDEFLTTRIVRRRVVIKTDEMPEFPSQSVMEETYKDENGHTVVKKVTRKIIRKCVSADGLEHEEVSSEGAPQESISMAEGDGYSKVVKRTVLKSEGDQTEVTFAEREGFSASSQGAAEGCKVSCKEKTMMVEGERQMTHHGDPSLASDLPSAQDDFKQALGYISGFSRAELPHVVERETVKEDGTVVRRARMRKGCTHRRTVVKEAGQRKHVLLEQVDNPRKGSKPNDLQQHLHQLFHSYYTKEDEDNNEKKEEKEE
ncbi:ankyrin-2-like isoform X2 [Pseudochaenichthys georgianus]|uniref:ankyrin-2-like isoform X2 n=1 Tax=Pseudochaenichthys georgianus TaxID=52239 RepID=UPI00146DF949|nr:ankyrin-2-like isoform X2 [Pseudochaenichthys georgianus]